MPDADHLEGEFVNLQMFRIIGLTPPDSLDARQKMMEDPMVAAYMKDAFLAVHPEDIAKVRRAFHVTVLKAAHHGSANGASYAWIKAVQPQVTVISCGQDNPYGHPHQAALDLLKQYGSAVYRTDLQGDITITSDGSQVTVTPSANADADVWVPGSTPESTPAAVTRSIEAPAASTETESQQSYVVNKNSHKFHYPDCSAVKKMSAKNRWDYTGTRQDLIDQGYEPCKICNP